MGGFLPLLEAFIAFALTMAALTTAVSALVGTWHKLGRARAYGMRMQMVYFFRHELAPMIGELATDHPALAALAAELADRTASADAAARNFTNHLAGFLVDTTLLPAVVDFRGAADPHADARVAMLKNGLDHSRWFVTGSGGGTSKPMLDVTAWFDRFYRWRSLRFGLDSLPEAEFRVRFTASTIGASIATAIGPAAFPAVLEALTRRFDALGNASTERFQRKAHVASFVFGFVLAFAANIDSLNLIGAYMSRPELTRRLLADLDRGGAGAERADVTGLLPGAARIDELRRRLESAVNDPLLGQMSAPLQERVKRELADLEANARQMREAATDAVGVIAGATQAFPVGWSLYPNCGALGDPRCAAVLRARDPGAEAGRRDRMAWMRPTMNTARADPGGFSRWLIGVLLTGVMLGLGTPFWVQVINGALYARNLLRGGADSTGTGSAKA